MRRATIAEIDLHAIADNVREIRKAVGPSVRIMPAVKANGYGHGAIQVARASIAAGADMPSASAMYCTYTSCCIGETCLIRETAGSLLLISSARPKGLDSIFSLSAVSLASIQPTKSSAALYLSVNSSPVPPCTKNSLGSFMLGVASLEEAIELREASITVPILLLGCVPLGSAAAIVENDVSAAVCNLDFGRALADQARQQGKMARIHVKVDTGMGRLGVSPEDAVEVVTALFRLPLIVLEGVFTHFSGSDEKNPAFTKEQTRVFKNLLIELKGRGISPMFAHAANSGGVLDHPDAHFDLVRPGIMVYGCYPSPESSRSIPLKPAMTFKSAITSVREVGAGKSIRSFNCTRPTRVATVAAGYADGYSRFLSDKGRVIVNGCQVPIIGGVCMDCIVVDVTNVPGVDLGTEVILFGGTHDCTSVERIAELLGTIPHDVLCAVSKRVTRAYVGSLGS